MLDQRKEYSTVKKKITWCLRGFIFLTLLFYTYTSTSINVTAEVSKLFAPETGLSSRKLLEDCGNKTDALEAELNNKPRVPDAFTASQLRSGAFILYIPGVLYMFLGLSIVCDEYFVPALEAAAEAMQLSNDVAGATLMAAGGSAPELATSFIGTFMGSDIGFGTIVGSAVFNVFFVIAMCVIYSPSVLELTPWPLFRDCTIYAMSLGLLTLFFVGTSIYEIDWLEALILILFYFFYVAVMSKNEVLQNWFNSKIGKSSTNSIKDEGNLQNNVEAKDDIFGSSKNRSNVAGRYRAGFLHILQGDKSLEEMVALEVVAKIHGDVKETFSKLDKDGNGVLDAFELKELLARLVMKKPTEEQVNKCLQELDSNSDGKITLEEFQEYYTRSEHRIKNELYLKFRSYDATDKGEIKCSELENFLKNELDLKDNDGIKEFVNQFDKNHDGVITEEEFIAAYTNSVHFKERLESVKEEAETYEGVKLTWSENAGCLGKIMHCVTLPLVVPMYFTCPNVQRPQLTKYWPLSFGMSILWIGIFSIFMVQWATILGLSISIPPKVMGLIFVAAGTSIPDLLTSVLVAMKGNGDMAVSSSIGSNIFDVLIGLPLPWFFKSIISGPVPVGGPKDPVGISVGILLGMIVLIVLSICAVGWKMDRKLAFIFIVLYLIYLAQELGRYYGTSRC